ncbi:uncharacterized protein si:dkey-12l12.1 isoform X1 [Osmerus eperlanus]|uniref:uncharacterized protein si:dkey-12l12.1 isoform X1 n=1 Tax=Osmerus eperlanus TaxID=29151 RepID=UPI002E11DE54
MEQTVWVCLLCLTAGLLSHALDCSSQTAGCAGGQLRGAGLQGSNIGRTQPITRPGSRGAIGSVGHTDILQQLQVLSRQKRQLERSAPTHLGPASLPGAVSVKGFPNMLIQAERARRHLGHTGTKKKNKVKSRVGSYSLIVHDSSSPLQVTRVRRQLQEPPKKGKTGRSGAYSVLGDPVIERPKRSAQKRKNPK